MFKEQVIRISCWGEAYLDFLLRPIARPRIKASKSRNTTERAIQTIFLLKPQ